MKYVQRDGTVFWTKGLYPLPGEESNELTWSWSERASDTHREDAPAYINRDGSVTWVLNGRNRREDDEATIFLFPGGEQMDSFLPGGRHRGSGERG